MHLTGSRRACQLNPDRRRGISERCRLVVPLLPGESERVRARAAGAGRGGGCPETMSGAYTHEHAGCVVPRVDNPSNPPYNSVCDDTQLPSAGERAGNVDSEHNRKPVDPNEINPVNQLNYGQMAPLETSIGGSETFYQVFKDVPVNPPSHNSSSDAAATAKGNGMSSLPDRSLLDSSSVASSSWVPRTARFSIHPKASPFVIALHKTTASSPERSC